MRRVLRVVVLLLASLLMLRITIGLSAQQRQPPQRPKRIFVTVVDEAGVPVLDLSPGTFEVVEAGANVEVVRASLVTQPMRIALIVDTSEQARTSLPHIRGGLHAFLDAIPPQNEILLMVMGGQARVRVAPTLDRKALYSAVDSLFADGGSAVFLDALRESWTRFLRDAEDRWPVFVVIGTDGPDSSGTTNPQLQTFIGEILGAAATAHVIVMTSSTSSLATPKPFNAITASLNVTNYTGGHYEALAASSALPARMKVLGEQIAAHQQRMRSQYEVHYIGKSDDPQARIEVHVARQVAGIGLSLTRRIE
jgi:hypothetical protein